MYAVFTYLLYLNLAYVGVTATLIALSSLLPVMGFYGRILASSMCLLICSIYGVIISIILRLVGYPGLSQWAVARAFKWLMKFTTGVEFTIRGEEHLKTRPAVFIGNHQTELDVGVIGAIMPPYCSITAKKDLKKVPFLGQFMSLSGTVFIDRGNRNNAMSAFDQAASEMTKDRQSVFIFPEGTRSYYSQPDLLPFKKGAFHFAVKAQVPIVPVVVANYSNVLHFKSRRFQSGRVPVQVLPPIPTQGLTSADVDELSRHTREVMLAELVKITEESRDHGIAMPASQSGNVDGKTTGSSTGTSNEKGRRRVEG